MTLILAISFFPAVAIIAPLFIQYTQLGIINTYASVIITDTVFALPLTIWLLVAFFRELPVDLEDAAKVDGATTIQAFRKVIVPLAAPGRVHDGDPDVHLRLERVPVRQHVPLRRRAPSR